MRPIVKFQCETLLKLAKLELEGKPTADLIADKIMEAYELGYEEGRIREIKRT